jgi:hypothetical protein
MQLTKSRLHKIINCKVQTRKQGFKNTIISKKTNTNTKRQHLKPFNLRNRTIKYWN